MAPLARPTTGRLLSRKGAARPTEVQGAESRARAGNAIALHPAAMRRMELRQPAQRIRVSVRLQPETHRDLKTCGAITQRTQQSILVQALNEYLDRCDWAVRQNDGGRRNPGAR